jgi:hypothetical protein
MLELNGRDMRREPLEVRKSALDGHSYADEQTERDPSPWLDYAAR